MRSTENKEVGTAAFVLDAQQAFPGTTVKFLYLSDQAVQPITLLYKDLDSRRSKLASFVEIIWFERFRPNLRLASARVVQPSSSAARLQQGRCKKILEPTYRFDRTAPINPLEPNIFRLKGEK